MSKEREVQIPTFKDQVFTNEDGEYHNENGPAIIYEDGSEEYYLNGVRHRKDGPAINHKDGHQEYWVLGKRTRSDGPAVIYADGSVEYWLYGVLHRDENEGPTVINSDGSFIYYSSGIVHRENGPAVKQNGMEIWMFMGKKSRFGDTAVIKEGGEEWWFEGVCRSIEDISLPCKRYDSGYMEWRDVYGRLHRDGDPAIIHEDGSEEYYKYGQLHNDNGPARISSDGKYKEWYINGSRIKEESEASEYEQSYTVSNKNGELHNEIGPAVNFPNGHKEWRIHDKLHRTDGPAVITADGKEEYWENGKRLDQNTKQEDDTRCITIRINNKFFKIINVGKYSTNKWIESLAIENKDVKDEVKDKKILRTYIIPGTNSVNIILE